MNTLEVFANALNYIENNLQEDIRTSDVADACYCSKSALEKLFRCVGKLGVREYLIKRRMMLAARMLMSDSEFNMLDIALACGYGTNESFTRAFRSVWYCNPSEFKCRKNYSELFPRLHPPIQDGGAYMNNRRNLDITEMYDLFVQRRNCYFVCCDIKHLVPINEISTKAGDLAILETMNRMLREAGDDDIVFRIGGDEFVMLTASEEVAYAEDICKRIQSHNGEPIVYEGQDIPLGVYAVAVRFQGSNLRYRDLYKQLHNAIMDNKE